MSYAYVYETFTFLGLPAKSLQWVRGQRLYLLVWSGNESIVFDEMSRVENALWIEL